MFCYFGMIHHHAHPPLSMAARDEFRFSAILEFPTPRQQVQFFSFFRNVLGVFHWAG